MAFWGWGLGMSIMASSAGSGGYRSCWDQPAQNSTPIIINNTVQTDAVQTGSEEEEVASESVPTGEGVEDFENLPTIEAEPGSKEQEEYEGSVIDV
jgi:hypothetical protein